MGLRALLWIPLLGALPAAGAVIEDVEFQERVEVAGEALALHGVGLLRYRIVFRGYVAALYLRSGTPPERVLEDLPKRLELEYFWSIEGGDFGEAAEKLLARQLDPAELAPLRERLERLHASYRDVEPGDRYALDYAPGTGTTLRKNGEALVTLPGADFAAAYFGIWLGEPPLDASLRRQLLEGL